MDIVIEEVTIAKNMLANRICDTCIHSSKTLSIRRCKRNGLDLFSFLPEANTCENWSNDEQT